jgi:hypothetical protein
MLLRRYWKSVGPSVKSLVLSSVMFESTAKAVMAGFDDERFIINRAAVESFSEVGRVDCTMGSASGISSAEPPQAESSAIAAAAKKDFNWTDDFRFESPPVR